MRVPAGSRKGQIGQIGQMPMRGDYVRDIKCDWYLYHILQNSITRPVLFQAPRVEVLSGDPASSMISVENLRASRLTSPLSSKQDQAARPSLPPLSADTPINIDPTWQINIRVCLTDSSCCTTSTGLAYPELQPRYTGPIKRNLDCRLNRRS
jgi:hypothetical protein